jgi:UDP-N-acetylmuramyl pentapeptide phosphotransferase/UDP-N-acetylglucosamine-1-phosphate transferase
MISFVVSIVVSLAVTGIGVPLLTRAGVLDLPNARSSHRDVVPRGGGLGVLCGVLAGALVALVATHPVSGRGGQLVAVIAATLVLAGVGLMDDLRGLPAGIRLGSQAVVAAALSLWLALNGHPGGYGVAVVIVGTVWLVAYVNAFNFMDGINGISALSAAVAGGWYGWLGYQHQQGVLVVLGLGLAGASLGFLPWNAPLARVFLGDVGSYGIGCLLASLALVAVLSTATLLEAVAPLTVYLADTGWTLGRRLCRHEDVREGHREHAYQRLLDVGWMHLPVAAMVATLAALVCVLVQLLAWPMALLVTVVLLAIYLALPQLVARGPKVAP